MRYKTVERIDDTIDKIIDMFQIINNTMKIQVEIIQVQEKRISELEDSMNKKIINKDSD